MKWVLFKKNSISENSDSISETGFNSVRVLMTKVRYFLNSMITEKFKKVKERYKKKLTKRILIKSFLQGKCIT